MFQGLGWLSVPIIFVPLVCGITLSREYDNGLPVRLVGAWVGPVVLFFLGRYLNRARTSDGWERPQERELPFHGVYRIPLQYSALIFGVLSSLLVAFSPQWR